LHLWQLFSPSLGVLGRDNCSPANFVRRKAACFDLATNRGQTDGAYLYDRLFSGSEIAVGLGREA
jgi:hypothetical protein